MDTINNKMSDSNKLTKSDLYKLIDFYYKQPNILYSHQHNSFNQFIDEYIYSILKKDDNIFFSRITQNNIYNYRFKFDDIYLKPPTLENEGELMFPSDARVRSLTYSSKLVATITQIQEKIDIVTKEKTEKIVGEKEQEYHITNIPIMLRSKYCSLSIKKNHDRTECNYDPGGYFIVNGSEKVVVSLERMVENKPLVFIKKDQSNKIYTIQVNSKNYKTEQTQIFTIRMKKDNILTMKIPQFNEIPIFILVKALGIESDRDIINYVVNDSNDVDMTNLVRLSLDNTETENKEKILTQDDAIEYLISKMKTTKKYSDTNEEDRVMEKKMHLMHIFKKDILPHMGENIIKKAYYICNMIHKLLKCVLGRSEIDDRDSFVNKRIDVPGVLIGMLFKQYFKKMLNECNKFFKKRNPDDENPINIIGQIKPNIIEQGLKSALLTGSWGGSKKKGVAQVLARLSFLQTISYLRRVSSPTVDASTNKLTNPRHLHNTQYGMICPVETPEGAKVGLVKSLAMMGNVTLMVESQIHIIKKVLNGKIMDLEDVHPFNFNKYVKVLLNGEWLGMTDNPYNLVNKLRNMRRIGKLEKTVSVVFDTYLKELKLYCDGGRLYRPLLRVDNNKILLTKKIINELDLESNNKSKLRKWNDLLQKYPEIIEYVDIEESDGLMIAMYTKDVHKMESIMNTPPSKNVEDTKINRYDNGIFVRYTHCEIHPSLMLGVVASSIPYCNHNQSPRNIYQYSQARQAMGIYNSSYKYRLDISYVLHNPQTPLVTTRSAKYLHTDKLAAGENAIVAICTYSGYNQEDSIILNQSAIDRGLFRAVSFKKYQETIAKNPSTSQDDIFTKPDRNKVVGTKSGSYDKLNDKGYIPEETQVVNGDIIIGKISPIQPTGNNNKVYKDSSISYKSNVSGVIDKVWTNIYNYEGYEMYKMRIRSVRIPKIGDKMSSRHGQKGTIGITFRQEDMPFTEDGITPDLIINPNCIPSRMTVGQLIECVMGKVSAIKGHDSDGTPFNELNVKQIKEELKKLGYHDSGKEYLYNGMTGKKMKSMIFIGPTYYQRLKHLVDDKIHSRARGPRQILTRQPPEGRSRDGGLRFGEMERDCMIAHGMGQFLKERMMETSDLYSTHVCDSCGFFAQQMLGSPGVYHCPSCNNSTDISKINLTYGFKLLVQELMSMNIAPRIRVKKNVYNDLV